MTLTTGISVGNITFEEGTTLITGNTLTLAGVSGSNIDVSSGLTSTINSILAGSATLNKNGLGTFVTGGASGNTHTGAVNINAGVFEIAKTAFVGGINNAAAVFIASGATLRLNGAAAYTQETIGPLSGAGTVTNVGAAAVNLVVADGGVSTTFSGTLTDTTNNLNLVKNAGAGTLTLTGANSYDGTTTVSTGVLNIQNATALGTTTGGTTVASGAALEIQNNIAVGAEALSLAGTGVSSGGALRNVSGTNSYAGNITLTAATEIQSDAGSLSLSGNISGATFGLTFDGAGDTAVSGVIGTTSGTLTKNGAGTLTLSGANTYAGKTTINAGTVSINTLANVSGGASALGAPTSAANGTIAIGSTTTGAMLAYTGSGSTTNRVIDLAGTTGGATLDASGSGALVFTSAFTATGAGSKTLTLTGSSTAANTIQGAIVNNSGTNVTSLVKSGAGTWVLSGANTFTGTTAINGGTLRIDADNRLGTAPGAATANKLTFDGGTLETTASFTLNANRGTTINAGGGTFDVNAGTTLTYNGILAGAGTLTKADTGTLILGGATTNIHTGDINVNAGTLQIAKTVANTAIGDSAAVTVATGANLTFTGGVSETIGSLAGGGTVDNTNAAAIALTAGGNNTSTNFSGVIQDTGGNLTLAKTGTGTLTLSGATANTFAGSLNINDGTVALAKTAGVSAYAGSTINIGNGAGAADSAVLRLDSSNQIVDTAALVFASDGRLDLNGQTETVASIAGSGEILIGTGQLTAGNALDTIFSGELTGTTGTFTKTGTGTLTLASTINYGGVFELNSGTLSLSNITANIGTLSLTGNSTIDFAGAASTLNVTNLNLNGFTLNITNWTNATDYFFATNWTGATVDTTGAAPMNQVTFNGFSATNTKWQGYDSQVTPVPEPATYGALLVGAMTAFLAWRRRRA
ncbi:MAG: autotransporter-associated beta strand repeat-containing protein [Opitutae bacterium]|nr:autotransporter-associated beta strand repeat-containing protein [Opitutae bacterium]